MKDSENPKFRAFTEILIKTVALIIFALFLPLYVVIRTIVTIGQPLFYKIDSMRFNRYCKKMAKKGIHYINLHPPCYGTLMCIPPWNVKDEVEDDDDIFD